MVVMVTGGAVGVVGVVVVRPNRPLGPNTPALDRAIAPATAMIATSRNTTRNQPAHPLFERRFGGREVTGGEG